MKRVNPDRPDLRLAIYAINQMTEGRHNAGWEQVLTAGTTTTITDLRINGDGWVHWIPLDAAAAALIPSMYISDIKGGEVTITHGTAVGTELFAWIATGG